MIFALAEPATIEMDWPFLACQGSGSYVEGTRHFRAIDVTRLNVTVDLRRGKVVAMGVGPGGRTEGLEPLPIDCD